MRTILTLAILVIASTASAQSIYTPGYSGGVGPWQASRVHSGYLYFNHSAPVYPISYPAYSRGYGYGGGYWQREEQLNELRSIRREVEDLNWQRRWGR